MKFCSVYGDVSVIPTKFFTQPVAIGTTRARVHAVASVGPRRTLRRAATLHSRTVTHQSPTTHPPTRARRCRRGDLV